MSRRGRSLDQPGWDDDLPPMRFAESLLKAPLPLREPDRRHIRRLLSGAPEAVTLAAKALRSTKAVRTHLGYVSRYGRLPLWDNDGLKLLGAADIRELAQDWEAFDRLDSLRRGGGVLARPMTLAAPPGSDPLQVRRAVQAYLSRHFGGAYDYVYAFHTDRPHPHAHVLFRTLGADGTRLIWNRPDLQRGRARFASALREQGIEVQATSRALRGLAGRNPSRKLWRAADALKDAGPDALRTFRNDALEAVQLALNPAASEGERERRVAQGHRRAQSDLRRLAAALKMSPALEDRRLAQEVFDYVQRLPEPVTARVRLAQRLARERPRLEREQGAQRARGAGVGERER